MSEKISIRINGGEREDRELIGNVINKALFDSGFRNLATDVPMSYEHVPSLLDLMQQNNPDLFQREVFIHTRPYAVTPEKIQEIAERASKEVLESLSPSSLVDTTKGVLDQVNEQLKAAGLDDVCVSATLHDGTVVSL